MIRLGVTGGIGSGKSTICRVFQLLGVPIYYADARAKWLIETDKELVTLITNLLGKDAYLKGKYNTRFVGKQVFGNVALLEKLNKLVHPVVQEDWLQWCLAKRNQKLLIKEAAIMEAAGMRTDLDKVLYIYASDSTRVKRVMERDTFRSGQSIRNIISKQRDIASYRKISDFEIDNNDTELVIPQVLTLYNQLTSSTS